MHSKKKILIVINSLGVGGAESQVINIMNLLKDEFEFHVITILKNDESLVERSIDGGLITIHSLNLPQKPQYFPIAFFKILHIAKKIQPDLVHSILFYSNILSRWMKKFTGYKTLNSIYDTGEEAAVRMRLLKMTKKYVDKVFIDNNIGKNNYVEKNIQYENQVVYIPNGIEIAGNHLFDEALQQYIYKRIDFSGTEKLWLNVSRFAIQKDHKTLIEAFALLVKEFPDNKLLLVGDGSLVPGILQMINELGVQNNIYYLGRINDIYTLCKMSNQYVCSSFYEGMPIIIMQAMLFKLSIVATAVGAIPDLIQDGISGFTCDSKNSRALYNAMKRMILIGDDEKEAMRVEAYLTIKNKFSTTQLKQNYSLNYNKLINGI